MVVIAVLTKRVAAAPRAAIRTNRSSAVGAFSYSGLAARHSVCLTARTVFDLAEWIHVDMATELDSCLSGGFARSRLLFKEFLPAHDLGVARVLNFDPRRSILAVVSAVPQFCNHALQVFSAGKMK